GVSRPRWLYVLANAPADGREELRPGLQVGCTFERAADRRAQPPPCLELGAAGRTLRQMPKDLVRGLDEELFAQERVGQLAYVTAVHGGFVLAAARATRAEPEAAHDRGAAST